MYVFGDFDVVLPLIVLAATRIIVPSSSWNLAEYTEPKWPVNQINCIIIIVVVVVVIIIIITPAYYYLYHSY